MAAASSRHEWCSQFARTRIMSTICNSGTERRALPFFGGRSLLPMPTADVFCVPSRGPGFHELADRGILGCRAIYKEAIMIFARTLIQLALLVGLAGGVRADEFWGRRLPGEPTQFIFRAGRAGAEAGVAVLSGPLIFRHRESIVAAAARHKLPAIYYDAEYAESGGLMSYGPSLADLHHSAAVFVDKILKGRNPADLPVEQPTRFKLVVNMKAANGLGLTIPPTLLARADEVIE